MAGASGRLQPVTFEHMMTYLDGLFSLYDYLSSFILGTPLLDQVVFIGQPLFLGGRQKAANPLVDLLRV